MVLEPALEGDDIAKSTRELRQLAPLVAGRMIARCAPTGDRRDDEIRCATVACLEIATAVVGGGPFTRPLSAIERCASGWALDGVPLPTITRYLHDGMQVILDEWAVTSRPAAPHAVRCLFAALALITAAVSRAYLRVLSRVDKEWSPGVQGLASALLAGRDCTVLARTSGVALAESYWVFAVKFSLPLQNCPQIRAWWTRAREGLAESYPGTLAMAGREGATILIPATQLAGADTGHVATALSRLSNQQIHSAVARGGISQLPRTADLAHELVTLAWQHGRPAGLYRFDDLAIEHLLARPGAARDHLAGLLAPLDEVPYLLTTLRTHLRTDLNRRRTAHQLRIHINTLDHRIKRIRVLTGLDLRVADHMFRLRAALVAHDSAVGDDSAEATAPAPALATGRSGVPMRQRQGKHERAVCPPRS